MTQAAIKLPSTWDESCYAQPASIDEQPKEGVTATTHCALFIVDKKPISGYVKHFPLNPKDKMTRPTGLINEILGYSLLNAFGIPTPDAALCPCPHPITEETDWAFISCRHPNSVASLNERYNLIHLQNEHQKENTTQSRNAFRKAELFVLQAIADWTHSPALCAVDALMDNNDRNPGNLIRLDNNDILAIDHSNILGGCLRDTKKLFDSPPLKNNKLLSYLMVASPANPNTANQIVSAFEVLCARFYRVNAELKNTLKEHSRYNAPLAHLYSAVWWRALRFDDHLDAIRKQMGLIS